MIFLKKAKVLNTKGTLQALEFAALFEEKLSKQIFTKLHFKISNQTDTNVDTKLHLHGTSIKLNVCRCGTAYI